MPRVEHRNMPIEQAKEMGAMALFGEKYGDEVRVINYGTSTELCGGTHVENTGNIGMLKITSESSIAAGIRRIEAITGKAVEKAVNEMQELMKNLSGMLNNTPDIAAALKKSLEENAKLREEAEEIFKERVKTLAQTALSAAKEIKGIKVAEISGTRLPDVVKGVAFAVRALSPQNTAFIAATKDIADKPLLTVMLTDDVVKEGFNASNIVREAAKNIKGGGGGQPGFAQAGGKDVNGLEAAAEYLRNAFN